jgi:hypothetical protein
MGKNKTLTIALWILIVLGIAMVYLGGFYGSKVILPPVITGIGFFTIAWALAVLRK